MNFDGSQGRTSAESTGTEGREGRRKRNGLERGTRKKGLGPDLRDGTRNGDGNKGTAIREGPTQNLGDRYAHIGGRNDHRSDGLEAVIDFIMTLIQTESQFIEFKKRIVRLFTLILKRDRRYCCGGRRCDFHK